VTARRKSAEQRLWIPLVVAAVVSVAAMAAMGITALVRSHGTGWLFVLAAAVASASAVARVLGCRRRRSKSWPGTDLTR
jgi:hypothetical protein